MDTPLDRFLLGLRARDASEHTLRSYATSVGAYLEWLAERGILYTPDYVLNAGGVISAGYEYFLRSGRNPFSHELNRKNMIAHVEKIGPTLTKVFNIADAKGITPAHAADDMAESMFLGQNGSRAQSV